MSPPHAWTERYERGNAHHKRGEFSLAIDEYTEAIRLDREAPNAYVRRSLAYRALGDEARAASDERTANELGGPERNAWDRLVNRSRHRWNWDLANPSWKQTDPLSYKAVLLLVLNQQIVNGGLRQWVARGYGQWIGDLIGAARDVGTDASRQVAAAFEELSPYLQGWTEDDEPYEEPHDDDWADLEDDPFNEDAGASDAETGTLHKLYLCEDRYHQVQGRFVADVERWAERETHRA